METEPLKSHSKTEAGLDKLSNLPNDVTERILSYLPIKEAARTSVLSSKWRYKWAMLPHLVFDGQCVSTQEHTTFANIVDQVFVLHIGPIHTFKLCHQDLEATSDIDRWILHLSRNSIKELTLEIWEGNRYKIPSCLFSCQDLIDLDIYRCVLKPPPTFKAFRSLKNLRFEKVTLAQEVFENLIAYSPLLERLTLQNCDSLTHLKIDAPNLQFLVVIGAFEDVNFVNTLNLRVVNLSVQVGQRIVSAGNLVKFFVQLPHIRSLTMDFSFLQYLALERALPEKLPNPCLLKYLSISINCSDLKEILTVLCLLRSSPALEELEILAHQEDQVVGGEVNSWFDDNQNCPLTKLRNVKIISISDVKAELDFIKFLLSNSPVLRKMTVKPASAKGEIVTKLLQFRRASALAEIIYLNP